MSKNHYTGDETGMPGRVAADTASLSAQRLRIKRELRALDWLTAFGGNSGAITVALPPGTPATKVTALCTQELGAAQNIKKTRTRNAVCAALRSLLSRVRSMKLPSDGNGAVLFVGEVQDEADPDSSRSVFVCIEPLRPVLSFAYRCDGRFLTELVPVLDADAPRYGFIVIDGKGAVLAAVQADQKEILHQYATDVPRKHNKGGQSALRFARLRVEARHNLVRRVSELAASAFLEPHSATPNVAGVILAGPADFKNDLRTSGLLPQTLNVIDTVDVSYGGTVGLAQAISMCESLLKSVELVQQQRMLGRFFEEVAREADRCTYGLHATMGALEAGAVDTLIVWDKLTAWRVVVRGGSSGAAAATAAPQQQRVVLVRDQAAAEALQTQNDCISAEPLIDFLLDHHNDFSVRLEVVADSSSEGMQFARGFGGIGATLRYAVSVHTLRAAASASAGQEDDAAGYDCGNDDGGGDEDSDSEGGDELTDAMVREMMGM